MLTNQWLRSTHALLRIAVILVAIAVEPCLAQSSMLDFLRSRRDRHFEKVPREVLAFYYTWYGRPERHGRWIHWGKVDPARREISESTNYPALGAYDSHDTAVIDGHIELAKKHGLTGFIATWWGRGLFEDRAFELLMNQAEDKDFKLSVYWEVAPGKGAAQIDQAVDDLSYVLRKYGGRKPFLKVGGRPVVFVYGRVMDQVPFASWPVIIRRTREALGGDFLLIADGYQESFARAFDGVHTYNPCGWVRDRSPAELRELSQRSFGDAVRLAKRHGKISCVTVIPGYDDTKIRKPGLRAPRQGGQTYQVLWEQAIQADPDWVLITSWNEWHEGSEIEPSWEDGETYVRMTGDHAARFRATPHSRASVAADDRVPTPEMVAALRTLYRDKPMGVLPDLGSDLVYWIVDAGLELRELGWKDLLDEKSFTASKLPLTIYAGGEHYVKSVKEEGDVIRSLRRYLRDGGLILAVSTLPHPFFYDETGQVDVAAGQVGLPIRGSGPIRRSAAPGPLVNPWESPPANTVLAFHLATEELAGLPASAPFPAAGDLRWRPATASVLWQDDLYLPLAALKDDQGNHYGDGIVYVEHRSRALAGGKSIYVWMRMPDVIGPNALYSALLKFAARKLRDARPR